MRGALQYAIARALVAVWLAGAAAACSTGGAGEETRPTPTLGGGEKVYVPTGPGRTLEAVVDPEFHMAAACGEYLAGLRSAAVISRFRRSMISGGVFAGATKAYQLVAS